MENYLKEELKKVFPDIEDEYVYFDYSENINVDVDDKDTWLEKRTSYIYKVATLAAIDNNKCDYASIIIGTQRSENSTPEIVGTLNFHRGENDDMGRVIKRAVDLLQMNSSFSAE